MTADNLWRIASCCCIAGMKPGSLPPGEECDHCMGGGMWIRPSGHTFLYPGGPATGYGGKVGGPREYATASPAPSLVDRLARAMCEVTMPDGTPCQGHRLSAERIAAEYARLEPDA